MRSRRVSNELSSVALVTGAARGLGRTIAERLGSSGMRVAVAGRTQRDLDAVAAETGALPVALDVTDAAACEAAIGIETELGPLDLVVNNTGAEGLEGRPPGAGSRRLAARRRGEPARRRRLRLGGYGA